MRVVMLSKALVNGAYQRKCELIATAKDVELTVLAPQAWGAQALEHAHTDGYDLRAIPLRLNGNFHLHHYPTLRRELARIEPDIVHIDEEPYNLATRNALNDARALRRPAKTLFFSWQNLGRRYPPPFAWFESAVFDGVDAALAGSTEAADVLRAKGFSKPITVLPQFGVDEEIFRPVRRSHRDNVTFGYAGRLVEEKGIDVLLRAVEPFDTSRVIIAGAGPESQKLQDLALELGISWRVKFLPTIPSTEMPAFYRSIDALVLPSRTRSNWKEQFGRVLIEAMASGVPVLGSISGEIPNVIGEAGLVFPEGDISMLSGQIGMLIERADVRAQLGQLGRARVIDKFTMRHIANQTVTVYRTLLAAR
jgi:glycosyltransferase involved in cell wall biosynthesis